MSYRVEQVSIVDALDTSVLSPTDETVLTLITCYPFYYKGYAPDRYIVRVVSSGESTQVEMASSTAEQLSGQNRSY